MNNLSFEISLKYVPYVEQALTRLSYLCPAVEWSFDPENCNVCARSEMEDCDANALRKELFFQLYREKVQADTFGIRKSIYEAIGACN